MGPNYEFLLFDDLKFQTVANHLLFKDGDYNKGSEAFHQNLTSRELRKVVLRDDVSDLSKLEENFNERDDRIMAGEMKPRKVKRPDGQYSTDSDGMSSFDS